MINVYLVVKWLISLKHMAIIGDTTPGKKTIQMFLSVRKVTT